MISFEELAFTYEKTADWAAGDLAHAKEGPFMPKFASLRTQLADRFPHRRSSPAQDAAIAAVCTLLRENSDMDPPNWNKAREHIRQVKWLGRNAPEKEPESARVADYALAYGLGAGRGPMGAPWTMAGRWRRAEFWARAEIAKAVCVGLSFIGRMIPDLTPAGYVPQTGDTPGRDWNSPIEVRNAPIPIPWDIAQSLLDWFLCPCLIYPLGADQTLEFRAGRDGMLAAVVDESTGSPQDFSPNRRDNFGIVETGQRRHFQIVGGGPARLVWPDSRETTKTVLATREAVDWDMNPLRLGRAANSHGDAELQVEQMIDEIHERESVAQGDAGLDEGVSWFVERLAFGAMKFVYWSPNEQNRQHPYTTSAVRVEAQRDCTVQCFSCTCGRPSCAREHWLEGYRPDHDPRETFRSFLQTAVRGTLPAAEMTPESFGHGMLSAWLAEGW